MSEDLAVSASRAVRMLHSANVGLPDYSTAMEVLKERAVWLRVNMVAAESVRRIIRTETGR